MTTPLESALAAWRMKDGEDWPLQAIKDHQDMQRVESEYARALDEEDREDLERATAAFLASDDMVGILGRRDLDFTRVFAQKD